MTQLTSEKDLIFFFFFFFFFFLFLRPFENFSILTL